MTYSKIRVVLMTVCLGAALCLVHMQAYADETLNGVQKMSEEQEEVVEHEIPLYAIATDYSTVEPLDDAIARIGEDGNISPLLMQMVENNVIAVMAIEEIFNNGTEVPFNPLVIGNEEFSYIPFFDDQEAYESWEDTLDEELRDVVAPVIMSGEVLFPTIAEAANLHAVLNPHLDEREIIYHDNLIWLRNKVDALHAAQDHGIKDLNVVVSTTQGLPPNAKSEQLLEDLKAFVGNKPVQAAYLHLHDAYDKNTRSAGRVIMITLVPDAAGLTEEDIQAMSQEFGFTADKYDFEKDVNLSFSIAADTEASKMLLENSHTFYNKEK